MQVINFASEKLLGLVEIRYIKSVNETECGKRPSLCSSMQSDDTSMSSRPGHLRHCCPSLVAPSIKENNGVKYALRHGDSIQIFF
jgi:hypothetical protein